MQHCRTWRRIIGEQCMCLDCPTTYCPTAYCRLGLPTSVCSSSSAVGPHTMPPPRKSNLHVWYCKGSPPSGLLHSGGRTWAAHPLLLIVGTSGLTSSATANSTSNSPERLCSRNHKAICPYLSGSLTDLNVWKELIGKHVLSSSDKLVRERFKIKKLKKKNNKC